MGSAEVGNLVVESPYAVVVKKGIVSESDSCRVVLLYYRRLQRTHNEVSVGAAHLFVRVGSVGASEQRCITAESWCCLASLTPVYWQPVV